MARPHPEEEQEGDRRERGDENAPVWWPLERCSMCSRIGAYQISRDKYLCPECVEAFL